MDESLPAQESVEKAEEHEHVKEELKRVAKPDIAEVPAEKSPPRPGYQYIS